MTNMTKMKTFSLLSLSLFALIGASPAMADTSVASSPTVAKQDSEAVAVSSQFRKGKAIVDVNINLGASLNQGGKATINLQNSTGTTLSSIPLDLQKGAQQMTAWFDMTGMSAGNYKISVDFKDASGNYQGQSAVFSYPVK